MMTMQELGSVAARWNHKVGCIAIANDTSVYIELPLLRDRHLESISVTMPIDVCMMSHDAQVEYVRARALEQRCVA